MAVSAVLAVIGMGIETWKKLPPEDKKRIREAVAKGNTALAKKIAKASKKKFKLPFTHSPPEYPQCSGKTGMAMIQCLIRAIKQDEIPQYKKLQRLNYLIALNKKKKWAGMKEVRKAVANARSNIKRPRYPKKGNPSKGRTKNKNRSLLGQIENEIREIGKQIEKEIKELFK